jgi:hydroxyacylglutathione hydrolase
LIRHCTLTLFIDDVCLSRYSAHEYTLSNGRFALSVEPSNEELARRFKEVEAARARGEPTIPTVLGLEKRTNPFLRVDVSEEIRRNVGGADGDAAEVVFRNLRRAKDKFRG